MARVLAEIAQNLRRRITEPEFGEEPIASDEAIRISDLANMLIDVDMKLHSAESLTFEAERYYKFIEPQKPQSQP